MPLLSTPRLSTNEALNRSSRRLQRKRQRLPGYARHKRPDQPSQTRRDVSRQRNHFTLHVDSPVTLFHPPPGLHPPQKAAVLPRQLLTLVGLARVFHFRDVYRRAAA